MRRGDDHIDKIFTEGLQGQSRDKNWDNPSDKVWSGIAAGLPQRRRRGMPWWSLAIGFVVMASVAIGLMLAGDRSDTGDESRADGIMPETNVPSKDVNQTIEEDAGDVVEESILQLPQGQGDAYVSQGEAGQSVALGSASEGPGKMKKEAAIPLRAPINVERDRDDGAHIIENQRTSAQSLADVRHRTRGHLEEVPVQDEIAALAAIGRPVLVISTHAAIPGMMTDAPEKMHGTSRWGVEVFFAPALGSRRIDVAPDRPRLRKLLLEQEEEHAIRYDAGLSLAYAVSNRLAVGLGLEYADYLMRSRYTRQIRFTRAGETINDRGRLENNYRINLRTSYGTVATDVVVERSQSSVIGENTFITLEVPMTQSLHFVRVPLYVRFDVLEGRIPVYVRGGLTLHYLASNTLKINAIVSMSPSVDRIRTVHDGSVKGASRLTLGYQAGVGTAFPLTGRLSMTGEATLNTTVESIYEHEDIKIFPFSTGIRLGVRYEL